MRYQSAKLRLGSACSLALLSSLVIIQPANAHGYLVDPPSRAYACRLGKNTDCGAATYEPQSVGETTKGFPATGPVDGKIASGGHPNFTKMDIQTPTRWHRTEVLNRTIDFDWYYHAAHLTTGWEYFITKADWNPGQPLSRASFELTPFCTQSGGAVAPIDGAAGGHGPAREKHRCTLPNDRSGHHVILGAWTVADTAAAFYNVVDVDIRADGGPVDGWSSVGTLAATRALLTGDKVTLRAFNGSAPSEAYNVDLTIASTEQGQAQNWSLALAQKLNAAHSLVRAGLRDEDGAIEPVRGTNTLFAKADSSVTSYQQQFDLVPDTGASMTLQGVPAEYVLDKGRVEVVFNVATNRDLQVEALVFDANHKQVGSSTQRVNATTAPITVDVRTSPGVHQITLIGSSADGRVSLQAAQSVQMTGEPGGVEYDFVYPQGKEHYKAGVKVFQEKTGEVYECKPFPYAGWCPQSPAHYEPGTGSSWQDAWNLM